MNNEAPLVPRMKRRWHNWAFGIFAGLMAILFLGFPASCILVMVYYSYPPSIVGDQLAGAGFQNRDEVSRKLTVLLQRKFPTGTSEGALKSTLLKQGFKADCVPPEQAALQPRSGYFICPAHDPSKVLQYRWGTFICNQILQVRWSTDDRHELTDLHAIYDVTCL